MIGFEHRGGFAGAAALRGGPLALCMFFLPSIAAAEERRTTLSVTATVVPSCRVSAADTRCTSETSWSAATTSRSSARPVAAAASALGEPVLRDGRIFFAAAAARPPADGDAATSYLTITY